MVTLENIRNDLSALYAVDKDIKVVEVHADTLDEALADAAVQLETRVALLDYEVVERGFEGFMGISRKPWTIKVYLNEEALAEQRKSSSRAFVAGAAGEEVQKIIDKDAEFFVRRFGDKIYLKVVLPQGDGKSVDFSDVSNEIHRSDTINTDEALIKTLVESGSDNEYKEVGSYSHISANDAMLIIDISKDEMKAMATVTAPQMSGADVSKEMFIHALKVQGVVIDIEEEHINSFLDHPVYNVPTLICEAPAPYDGKDAYIQYNFETDKKKLKAKEDESGQINFKELNQIQNVVVGQPLAVKIPAERGKAGKTLTGRYLEAKNGRDINMPLGKNVEVDKDGVTIIATENGQVVIINDKINVEPIMEVPAVNIKTGNITFLGSVIVKGSVEDGFDIKATGNIEIGGAVGKCKIESEGNIVISQGVMGRDEGELTAGGSIWAKFINNTKVFAGESVIVSDSIMNSEVTAMKKILLKGKRAQITGGHLFATEEINAKNIGSNGGGAETVLEVGVDPQAKKRMLELIEMQNNNVKELDEIELNIQTLQNLKEVRKSIPKEKEEALNNFLKRRDDILNENEGYTKEITDIQDRLHELKAVGKVAASGTVYAGVKVFVREEKDEVISDVKNVTFYYEDGFVRRGKYEAPIEEKGPDGYSSN